MNSKPRAGILALAGLYLDIALWRRGPQDVPSALFLLPLTVCGYFLLNALCSALLPAQPSGWFVSLCLDVPFTALWYWALLHLCGRRARTRQTLTAIFGFQALLALPLNLVATLVPPDAGTPPGWPASLALFAMLLWLVLALAHVVRAALEWPLMACVLLAVLQLVTEDFTVHSLLGTGA